MYMYLLVLCVGADNLSCGTMVDESGPGFVGPLEGFGIIYCDVANLCPRRAIFLLVTMVPAHRT